MIELSSMQRGGSLYIVYDLNANPHPIDNTSVMMINSNQKRSIGLAKISFDEQNGQKERILFDVTGMMPLSEFLRRNLTQDAFRRLILAIIHSIESFDDYMISVEQVILNPDYVYINVIAEQVDFLCLPFADGAGSGCDLYDFFRQIVNIAFANVDLQAGETSYFNLVANVFASKSAFSLENLRQVLMPQQQKSNPENAVSADMQQPQAQSAAVEEYGDVVFRHESSAEPYTGTKQSSSGGSTGGFSLSDAADEGASGKQEGSGSLIGSLIRKFLPKKKAADPAEESEPDFSGGLAGLASGKDKKQKKQPEAPAQPAAPAKQPVQTQPVNEEMNHTIYVSEDAPAKQQASGFASALNQREQRAQRDLYSDPAPAQQHGDSGILGGMAGIMQNGLPTAPTAPMQTEKPKPPQPFMQIPPAPDAADPKTELLDDDPKTELIDDDPKTELMLKFCLISKRDGSRIALEKPVIRVGRNRPEIDIDLRHNTHVGHYHASLIQVGGGYTVIDEKSANHTYVNHQMVQVYELPKEPVLLQDGDLVVFADEAFEYHIEQ